MKQYTLGQMPTAPPGWRVCWFVGVVEMLVVITIAACVSATANLNATTDNFDATSGAADTDLTAKMLGVWEDDYEGHRILTLRPDGTGTMVVELKGMAAMVFAKKMTFQEEWSVENQRVTMNAVSGEPTAQVKIVLTMFGDTLVQRIESVTSDRMILIEEPKGTRFEWRRVEN